MVRGVRWECRRILDVYSTQVLWSSLTLCSCVLVVLVFLRFMCGFDE